MSLWGRLRGLMHSAEQLCESDESLAVVERQRQVELRLVALRAQTLRRRQMQVDGGRNARNSQSP
jgi:hypothetical protein